MTQKFYIDLRLGIELNTEGVKEDDLKNFVQGCAEDIVMMDIETLDDVKSCDILAIQDEYGEL